MTRACVMATTEVSIRTYGRTVGASVGRWPPAADAMASAKRSRERQRFMFLYDLSSLINVKVDNRTYRSIWPSPTGRSVHIIDQTRLPFEFATLELESCDDVATAITTMQVRGAPLIGVAAAYGLALAMRESSDDAALKNARAKLLSTRPTAVNLRWALNAVGQRLAQAPAADRFDTAWRLAAQLADEDVERNRAIGRHGAELLQRMHATIGRPVNVLTHCNAGWLA